MVREQYSLEGILRQNRKVLTRERLIAAMVALVVACGAFVYGLRWLQSLMTFRPDRMTAKEMQSTPEGAESVWFTSADGTVINEKRARPERIVLYGHSLGTAVAAAVASRGRFGAVVLESGFSSASSLATTALPWLPQWLHFLGRNRFESARKLVNVKSPVLIAHGDPDATIPTLEAQALFASANEPKKLLIFSGAGHSVFGALGEQYLTHVDQFIRESLP